MRRIALLKQAGLVIVVATGLVAVVGIAATTGWVSASTAVVPQPGAGPAPVVAATKVERADLVRTEVYTAELKPYLEADLHAKVAGYLTRITVDIGDRVTAGQMIAALEMPEQEADLAKAKADYDVMKLNFDRIDAVARKEPGLLAQQEVDKARGDFEMARAALDRARAMVEYGKITVPFSGVITKRYADPGALIQAGTSSSSQAMPIVHLAELSKLRLDFPVPQSLATSIRIGMPVKITIPSTGDVTRGFVARYTDDVERTTRMMRVEVDVDNADLHLKPGMYATAELDLQSASHAMALPVQAVEFGDKPDVWVIAPEGTLQPVPVVTGMKTADKVEILSGLRPGDTVVYGNRGGISPGMTVTPKYID